MEKQISAEDLKTIQDYKLNVSTHNFQIEKSVLENQIAELQLQNVMLRLYVKYGLDDTYSINYDTGEISRKEQFIVEPIHLDKNDRETIHQEIIQESARKGAQSILEEEDNKCLEDLDDLCITKLSEDYRKELIG